MKLPLKVENLVEVRCLECGLQFCCIKCRRAHEEREHNLSFNCPICRMMELPLGVDTPKSSDLMKHVASRHLPLSCNNCGDHFETADDLSEVAVCKREISDAVGGGKEESKSKRYAVPTPFRVKKEFDRLKSDDKSSVMTSTPTHPATPHWSLFQKSFASTLSGINSPDSDAVESPPGGDQKPKESAQLSSIRSSESTCDDVRLKSIMSKSQHLTPGSSKSPDDGKTTPPLDTSESFKRKRVTFADEASSKKAKDFEFLRPRRISTPGRIRPKRTRTPRFQAIINNFESRTSTPKQVRPETIQETTPPTTESNGSTAILTARAINFKQDESPTTIESVNNSPILQEDVQISTNNSGTQSLVSSPLSDCDITNSENYKTCLQDDTLKSIQNTMNTVEDLSKHITKSIQDKLESAFLMENCKTEFQLNIQVTQRFVSMKETKKIVYSRVDTVTHSNRPLENESTTVWSRLVNGLKWVVWGHNDKKSDENYSPDASSLPGAKRKRDLLQIDESPVSCKRQKYSGRISGRRPLHSMVAGLERSQSSDISNMWKNFDRKLGDKKQPLNRSF